jgi:hypothetical protein
MATFLLKPNWKKGRGGLEKGRVGVEATFGSGSLLWTGGVGGGCGGGASGFEGLTPFMLPIPSIVTVFPSGIFSAFSSFFFPIKGRLEHEVDRKRKIVRRINTAWAFLPRIMVALSIGIDGDREKTLLYYMICERCQGNEGVFKGRGIRRWCHTSGKK